MIRNILCTFAFSVVVVAGSIAGAAPPRSELADFLAVLRQRGYADFAAEYLESRKDDPTLPADVRETWDVEMANSLWIAASQTSNDQEESRRRELAQKHLDAFLKEHPKHPAVADAMITWGTAALDRGVARVYLVKTSTVEVEKETHLKAARELLTDAHARLTKAIEACESLGAKKQPANAEEEGKEEEKPAPKKAPVSAEAKKAETEAAELTFRLAEARFKLALANYWLAQTFDEADANERATRLKAASAVFDEIYRDYKGQLPGYIAYYWQARVKGETETSDDALQDAAETCDEISMLLDPEEARRGNINPAILSLVGDTVVLHMQVLTKNKQAEAAINIGATWLGEYPKLENAPAWQAVAIEWVKTLAPNLENVPDLRRRAGYQKTMVSTLNKISRGRGPYQREAALLLAKINKQLATGGKAKGDTFDEVLAAAESALIAEQWASAATGYKRAAELLKAAKMPAADKQKQDALIQERLAHAQFQLAVGLATENKLIEAAQAAETLMRDAAKTPVGPMAATLALQTVQKMATDPKLDKAQQQVHVERLQKLAELTLATWPRGPEADEARFVLGQIGLMQNNDKQAISMLTSLSPTSPRYSAAMLSAGRFAWRRYREEMAKPEKERNAQVLESRRTRALEWLTAGTNSQRPQPTSDAKQDEERELARRKQAAEVKLVLAEVQMECGKTEEAMANYQALIDAGLNAKTDTLDETTLRALGAALNSNIKRGNLGKASQLAVELGKRSGDQPQINALLVNVLKFLVKDLQQAEADDITAAEKKDAAAMRAAGERLSAARKNTANLLAVLAEKKQLSAVVLVFMGDNCIRVGMKAEGQTLYQRILDEAAGNPAFAKDAAPALTRTRTRLIGMLSEEKKYPEALKQIDALLVQYPKALDVLVQKGRILQAWAKTDPTKYDAAVNQWADIRNMLAGAPQKPPEYYEAIYNTAECLVAKSEREKKTG